jgi:phage shock protein PspC (stress-responsive transcriptional regulator)
VNRLSVRGDIEMSAEYKKLYRSRDNRILGGVCGGIGHYLNIDPTAIRLIYILFALWFGSGILAYIIFLILVPEEPYGSAIDAQESNDEDPVVQA